MMNSGKSYMERLALVTARNEDDNTVTCEYGVNGLCGSCSEKSDDCAPDLFSSGAKTTVFSLKNTFDAKVNQVVRVGVPAKSLLLSSFISYGIPLIFMLSCAGLAFWLASGRDGADMIAAAGAFLGLVAGFVTAAVTARIMRDTVWNPKMLGVLPFSPQCKNTTKSEN